MSFKEQLQQQINEINNLRGLGDENPQFKIWYVDTLKILKSNFEKEYTDIFANIFLRQSTVMTDVIPDYYIQVECLRQAENFLQIILNRITHSMSKEKIDIKNYNFHDRIQKVSGGQFQNDHFKEAILNAFVEVITRVKEVAKHPADKKGKELDGDNLMNEVFGCDGNTKPVIKLNELKNSLDKVEQRGFMYLYKGICGIRDKKAHLNFLQKDPNKTIEYLSLASLLMRLLDDNYLKKFNQ
ncbi:MAG: TIGR02391 family protein [Patescibacteria group bacterium]